MLRGISVGAEGRSSSRKSAPCWPSYLSRAGKRGWRTLHLCPVNNAENEIACPDRSHGAEEKPVIQPRLSDARLAIFGGKGAVWVEVQRTSITLHALSKKGGHLCSVKGRPHLKKGGRFEQKTRAGPHINPFGQGRQTA